MSTDRDKSIVWARNILAHPYNVMILDTETTGLKWGSEIVQISAIDATGTILLDTLIKPTRPIPSQATAIHGITDAMVAKAQTWASTYGYLVGLAQRFGTRITYNASYDVQMIHSSCKASGIEIIDMGFWDCAMLRYAAYYGDWNDYFQSYIWQKLPGGDHSALGDCRATLALIQRMAQSNHSSEG